MSDQERRAEETQTGADRRAAEERRAGAERRGGAERRQRAVPVDLERRSGADRRDGSPDSGERRKVERRINEYVLEPDVLEFINAVNEFKTRQQKPFPTWSDVYRIFVSLGYRKSAE
jgi:hypothetical protein